MKFDEVNQQLQALQQRVLELLSGSSVPVDVQQQLAFLPTAFNQLSLTLVEQQVEHEALHQQYEEMSAAYQRLESRCQQIELELQQVYERSQLTDLAVDGTIHQINITPHNPVEVELGDCVPEEAVDSTALLRLVISNAPIVLYALDAQGVFTLSEGKGLESVGLKSGEVVGRSAFEIHQHQPHILSSLRRVLEGTQQTWQGELDNIFYENHATPLCDEMGQIMGLIGVATDITERYQSQQALQESEKRFRQAIDHFPDTFVIYDKERRFQFVNATGLRLSGLPESALLGHTDEEIHPPEITNAYLPFLEQAIETKQQQAGECTITLPRIGQITFIVNYVPLLNEQGEIEQILGITYDITRRKQLEDEYSRLIQQLESERAQLEAIISSLPDAVYIGDTSGIWKCNDRAVEMLGFTSVDDLKHNIAQLSEQLQNRYSDTGERIAPEDEVFVQALQGTSSVREVIVRHLQTGCDRIIRSAASPIRCGEAIIGAVAINTDITERQANELLLKSSLQEKEILLREIHHRVKNNLQVISSLLDLQAMQIQEPATLDAFQDSCHRIKSMALIHEQLYHSQDFTSINFAAYLETLISHLFQGHNATAKHIESLLQLEAISLNLEVAVPCGLIVNELVSNALKHAFPAQSAGTINVSLKTEDGQLTLRVKDDGVGLPSGWNLVSTSSLGLQLVKVLTQQIHATLECHQEAGTEFCLRFPENL